MAIFRWTKRKEEGAFLVAQGELKVEEIGRRLGVRGHAVTMWKREPQFKARVEQVITEIRAAILKRGIAIKENRIKALNDRWDELQRIIKVRAELYKDVPGGDTGLLIKRIRRAKTVETVEYVLDVALLRELREIEKQAALELGQWTEQVEQPGQTRGVVIVLPDNGHGGRIAD